MIETPLPLPGVSLRHEGRRRVYDAIVIGSGVGGCVAAARLARDGERVLVLEKNPGPGGILASYERRGFKFDMGSHLVAQGERGALGRAVSELGVAPPRLLTHAIPVRSRGIFEATAPPTRRGLLATAFAAADSLHLPAGERLRLARLLAQVFTLTEWELRSWDRRTLDEFVRSHTDHPGAYFLFSFLASIFYVLPPWDLSAGEAIRGLRSVLRSYSLSYVAGGMDQIAASLLRRVLATGGDVVVGQRAASIRRKGERLEVLTEAGDAYEAVNVACNLAPLDLLPLLREPMPADWVARVRGIRPSGNAHQLKLALRRPLVDEGCLIGGLSLEGLTVDDLSHQLLHASVADIAAGRVSDPLAIYAPVPSNYDPSLAPAGCQLIVVSVYGPTCADPVDPPERWHARVLDALERVIPGVRDALLFEEFSPIASIGGWMGKSSNAAICNGQYPGQVGRDRLPVVTPLPGLYLVGDGAGGRGIGIELAASSALEAAAHMRQHGTAFASTKAAHP